VNQFLQKSQRNYSADAGACPQLCLYASVADSCAGDLDRVGLRSAVTATLGRLGARSRQQRAAAAGPPLLAARAARGERRNKTQQSAARAAQRAADPASSAGTVWQQGAHVQQEAFLPSPPRELRSTAA